MNATPGTYLFDGLPSMLLNCPVDPSMMIALMPDGMALAFEKDIIDEEYWCKVPKEELTFQNVNQLRFPGQPEGKMFIALSSGHILDESLNLFTTPDWLKTHNLHPVYVSTHPLESLTIRFPQ